MFGGGGGAGRAQDVIQDELAALHRRGAIRIRGHHQNARVSQHAAARAVLGQRTLRISSPVTPVIP